MGTLGLLFCIITSEVCLSDIIATYNQRSFLHHHKHPLPAQVKGVFTRVYFLLIRNQ